MTGNTDTAREAAPRKGEVFITPERCKGCSFCVVFCPTETLVMGKKMNAKGYFLPEVAFPDRCNGCDMCGLYCPDFAIFGVRLGKGRKADDE